MIDIKDVKIPISLEDYSELYDIIDSTIIGIGFILYEDDLSSDQEMGLNIMLDELHNAREIMRKYE